MVRFEDLNKVYAGFDYPFLDRSGLPQADANLQLDLFLSPNWKILDKRISNYNLISESQICNEFYCVINLKINYTSGLKLLEERYNLVLSHIRDNGEKVYKNPSFDITTIRNLKR